MESLELKTNALVSVTPHKERNSIRTSAASPRAPPPYTRQGTYGGKKTSMDSRQPVHSPMAVANGVQGRISSMSPPKEAPSVISRQQF